MLLEIIIILPLTKLDKLIIKIMEMKLLIILWLKMTFSVKVVHIFQNWSYFGHFLRKYADFGSFLVI